MRTTDKARNIMRGLIELVTYNWWLKIIALLLAVVIYHSLKPANNNYPRAQEKIESHTKK